MPNNTCLSAETTVPSNIQSQLYPLAPGDSFRILTEFSGIESPFQFSAPYTLSYCINLHWLYQYKAPSFSQRLAILFRFFQKYTRISLLEI